MNVYLGQISDQNGISCSFVAVQCYIWREMRCWRYTVQWFNELDLGELILLVAHRHTNQDIHAALFHAAQKRLSLWTFSFKPYPSHSYSLLILKLMIFTPKKTEPEIVKTLMIICTKSCTEYQLYWNVTMFHTGYSKWKTTIGSGSWDELTIFLTGWSCVMAK